jgi:CheY-like chemotaxis protein
MLGRQGVRVSAGPSPLRVLWVSPRAEEANALESALAPERGSVARAANASAACEALAGERFDAVVVSHPLPDAEAVGTCAALSAVPGCPPLLVIDGVDRTRELAQALPADARPARCVARPVAPADLRALLGELTAPEAEAAPDASVDRRGFANVLLDLAARGETGVLEVRSDTSTTRIYVRRGAPISVEGGSLRETLGRLLVRTGELSERDYERVIQRMTEQVIDNEYQRMGEVLIQLGLMRSQDVFQALSLQAGEKIVEAFAASRVELAFEATPELPSTLEPLAVPPFPALLVESVKRHFSLDEQNDLILPIARSRMRMRVPAPDLRLSARDVRIASELGRASSVAEFWRKREEARPVLAALALVDALVAQAAVASAKSQPIARVPLVRRHSAEFARDVVSPPKSRPAPGASDDTPSAASGRAEPSKTRLEAERLFHDAKKLAQQEKFVEALAVLQRAVALQPDEPEYRMHEAWVAYLSARVTQRIARAKAIACARKMIEADPRSGRPRFILGRLLLDEGDADAGVRELELALMRDPADEDAKKALAKLRAAPSPARAPRRRASS